MDNYGTHKTPRVRRWLQRHPRYVVHFTPTSASWRNQVERFFAQLTEKRLRRGVLRSVAALEAAIRDYLEKHNQTPKPLVWTATADLIFQKIQKTPCFRAREVDHGALEVKRRSRKRAAICVAETAVDTQQDHGLHLDTGGIQKLANFLRGEEF